MSDVTTELAMEASDKAMEIARLKAENTELRESVKRLMTQRDERLARAEAENAKLRELVKSMYYDLTDMTFPPDWVTDYAADMRELGVDE